MITCTLVRVPFHLAAHPWDRVMVPPFACLIRRQKLVRMSCGGWGWAMACNGCRRCPSARTSEEAGADGNALGATRIHGSSLRAASGGWVEVKTGSG